MCFGWVGGVEVDEDNWLNRKVSKENTFLKSVAIVAQGLDSIVSLSFPLRVQPIALGT